MVQEVQQQGNWYQTPNEIQGIWDTRRRVVEHTQVTPSFSYECTATGNVWIAFGSYATVEKKWQINSITSSYGNTVFKINGGGLQIPLAWAYLIEVTGAWGTTYVNRTHTIRIGKQDLISVVSTSSLNPSTISRVVNLWRWNLLEYYGKVVNPNEWGANREGTVRITLRKL